MYEAGKPSDARSAETGTRFGETDTGLAKTAAGPTGTGAPLRSPGPGLRRIPWLTLGVIAVGGVIGALARQGLWALFPRATGFDWTTLGINVGGCFLIGVLMAAITEVWRPHRLAALFLGPGVLGGFTTFSTYIVDIQKSIISGSPGTGLAYLAATLATALVAVYGGITLTRLVTHSRGKDRS